MDESEDVAERKRGRPKGSLNRTSSMKNWQPKKWKPLYDWVLVRHIVGESHKEIAAACELSEIHVGNIIRSEIGQQKIQEIRGKGSFYKTIEEKLEHIKKKSVDRMVAFIDNDQVFEKRPIESTDRAIKIAETLGAVGKKQETENKVVNNHINIFNKPQIQNDLEAALAFSAKARLLNPGESPVEDLELDNLERIEAIEDSPVPKIPQLQKP